MSVSLSPDFELAGGEVDLNEAERLKELGLAIIASKAGPFEVDCKGLQQANSVTVALMICWHRHATLMQKEVVFLNLSKDLHNIIAFSGLSGVLQTR
jgi:ABC-type transporter Mla MlaB component